MPLQVFFAHVRATPIEFIAQQRRVGARALQPQEHDQLDQRVEFVVDEGMDLGFARDDLVAVHVPEDLPGLLERSLVRRVDPAAASFAETKMYRSGRESQSTGPRRANTRRALPAHWAAATWRSGYLMSGSSADILQLSAT